MKILLDTNMMLVPHQFGVDIFEFLREYEIITLSSCMDELRKLSKKRGDEGLAARVGLKLLKENRVKTAKTKEKGDKSILNYAVREKCAVATNDKGLIEALKTNHVKIIRLKQKKYLAEE